MKGERVMKTKFIQRIRSTLASEIKFYYTRNYGLLSENDYKQKVNKTLRKLHLDEFMYRV